MIKPSSGLRARLQRWWLSRLPLSDHIRLTQRNVYILPTGPGLMLGATLLLLLISSINYQLNLGYVLTFLITGCALVAMHVGHGTLRGLDLHLKAPEAVHAGQEACVAVSLHNHQKRGRYAIALGWNDHGHPVWLNVEAQGHTQASLRFKASHRGLHTLPTVLVSTLFPLGCFRVWSLWRPGAKLLVYPQAEARAPALPLSAQDGVGVHELAATQAAQELDLLRPYRAGDPLKSIVWKKVARSGELISREAQSKQRPSLWLSLQLTGASSLEAQLSRLCAWLLEAERQNLRYGLRLQQQELAPSSGPAHLALCLRTLALA